MNMTVPGCAKFSRKGKMSPISERDGKLLVVTDEMRDVDFRCPSCSEFEAKQGSSQRENLRVQLLSPTVFLSLFPSPALTYLEPGWPT